MVKMRTKIYVKVFPEKHEVVYSGIEFAEFVKFLQCPIENLLLLKGDYWGSKHEHNFELLEGLEEIKELLKEDVHNFGDFCFVDYFEKGVVSELGNQQVAELLYMAHLGEPLQSPFFTPLHNRA